MHFARQHTPDVDANNFVMDLLTLFQGHKDVPLPPYHCQYNSIELIWTQIWESVAGKNTKKINNVTSIIQDHNSTIKGKLEKCCTF